MSEELFLQSNSLSATIDVQRGGNIRELIDFESNTNWIYYDRSREHTHNATVRDYDERWCGGFEELFPNDAPCVFEGRNLLDHGELWDAPFTIIEKTNRAIHLQKTCYTVPAIVEKKISLHTSLPKLTIEYSLSNISNEAFSYLFKLHPAIAIKEGDTIQLSGGKIIPVDLQFSKIIDTERHFSWPFATMKNGTRKDLRIVPSFESSLQEFVYVSEMPEGYCGIMRSEIRKELRIHFPLQTFPYCWMFMTYGGWRNHYTLVLEPCTNMPKDLASAKKLGQCAFLHAGEKKIFTVEIEIVQ